LEALFEPRREYKEKLGVKLTMIRTFNYPLRPTASQDLALEGVLLACQRLYNAALEQRRDAYRKQKKSVTKFDQMKDLTELRKHDSDYSQVAATVLRSPLFRLDRAFQGFFRRIKSGQKPGFPRFKSRDRYNSFSFPCQPGIKVIKGNLVRVPSFGDVKFHCYRPLRGVAKECHVRRTAKGWTLSVVCDLGAAPIKVSEVIATTGIDVGLTHFATLANGEQIENPRFYRKSEEILARRQQALATKRKGSKSRLRAKRLVGRAHEHIRNQRLDFLRKLAKSLVLRYDLIAYEDLNIRGMVKSNLAKSINDASWATFIACMSFKAEEAGKYIVPVNPRGTSQRCSGCDTVVKKTLSQREHLCGACGLRLDRDHNAAINIEALGLSAVRQTLQGVGLTEACKGDQL
jgi:putative transposase